MGKGASIWNVADQCKLVQLYEKYHKVIVGAFKGPLKTTEAKAKAWSSLTSDFNSSNPDEIKAEDQIRTKIDNLKTKVRDYARSIKYHETGGGPAPVEPPAYINKLYEVIRGESGDSLTGIGSGMDSSAGTAASSSEKVLQIETEAAVHSIVTTETPVRLSKPPKKRFRPITEDYAPYSPQVGSPAAVSGSQLADEQLEMVRENRALIAERRELVARERYKVELEITKLKHDLRNRGIPPFPDPQSIQLLNDSADSIPSPFTSASGPNSSLAETAQLYKQTSGFIND